MKGHTVDELPIGALKARRRERHLCLGCDHATICHVPRLVDPNLQITITGCLMFDPVRDEPQDS